MAEEMKTRSIRADEQTLERFKALSEEFDNQGECLSSLIKAYEISKAKSVLTDTGRAIEDFETHTAAIQEIFITLLESISNADERIKNKYEIELQTRTRTISDLQMQNTVLNNQLDDAQNLLDLKQGIVSQLTEDKNKAESTITTLNNQLKDKEDIISGLREKTLEIESLKAEHKKLDAEIEQSKTDIKTKDATIQSLKDDLTAEQMKVKDMTRDAEIQKQKSELDKQLAVSQIKETYSDKVESLRAEKEKLLDEISKLKDYIRQLDQPKAEPREDSEDDNPEQLTFD